MTNDLWWKKARAIEASSQEQMEVFYDDLLACNDLSFASHLRGLYFKFKLYMWLFFANACMCFPDDFHPFTPGLEFKYAIEEAEKCGAKIHFDG